MNITMRQNTEHVVESSQVDRRANIGRALKPHAGREWYIRMFRSGMTMDCRLACTFDEAVKLANYYVRTGFTR